MKVILTFEAFNPWRPNLEGDKDYSLAALKKNDCQVSAEAVEKGPIPDPILADISFMDHLQNTFKRL
jgi:hypothetical protein